MKTYRSQTQSHSLAFTLIELLVVIAIIGLLAALIFPAVSSARQKAAMAEGAGNLRNVVTAALNLMSENEGRWFYDSNRRTSSSPANVPWTIQLSYFMQGGTVPSNSAQWKLSKSLQDPLQPRDKVTGRPLLGFAPLYGFFGLNQNFAPWVYGREQSNRLFGNSRPSSQIFFADLRKLSSADSRDNIQNYGKNGSVWSWFWSSPSASLSEWTHDKKTGYGDNAGDIDFKRGGGKAKVAFLDGHIEIVTPKTLTHAMLDPACNGLN